MTLVLKRPVIFVTGSSGKTTTKDMIASILSQRLRLFKSKANHNLIRYFPDWAGQIRTYHKAVVLECGIRRAGHLRRACRSIRPNIGIITMIGSAHIGNFGGSAQRLANAKSELILNMDPKGVLFINADDPNSRLLKTSKFSGKIVNIGINNECDYKALEVKYTEKGMSFQVYFDESYHEFHIPIFGEHNVYNALFAIAVAHFLKITPEEMNIGLVNNMRRSGRLLVLRSKKNARLIDDTYNANPHSVKAAIDVLTKISDDRNIVVLGNMAELGSYTQQGHKDVGIYLSNKNISYLFTLGKHAKEIGKAAIAHGFPAKKVKHALNRNILHKQLQMVVDPESTVLVKGSGSMKMDQTIKFLQEHL